MMLDLTFKDVCKFIKEDEPSLVETVDKFIGLGLILSPIALGPAGLALLPLLAVKNELTKLGKGLLDGISKKKDVDFLSRQTRLQAAYGLICYTAFFEALDRQLPADLRKKLRDAKENEIAHPESIDGRADGGDRSTSHQEDSDCISFASVSFPHPAESLAEQEARNTDLYQQMTNGFKGFLQKLPSWEALSEKQREGVAKAVDGVPKLAAEYFEAQYFELSRRYEDFAVWAKSP
jgi:hypothetical protein